MAVFLCSPLAENFGITPSFNVEKWQNSTIIFNRTLILTSCPVVFLHIWYNFIERSDIMDQIKIGKFIAELRKEHSLTQEQFAEKLGVSNRSVSRWENGKNMPDISLFIPICELLNISVNELIIGEKIEKTEKIEVSKEMNKVDEVIIETIKESNKTVKMARIIIYIAMIVLNAFFSIVVPITATPSDAMAVPLTAVFGSFVSIIVISSFIKNTAWKFVFVPISCVMTIIGSVIYMGDAEAYGFMYFSVIALMQFAIIFISMGIEFLFSKIKSKHKNPK